jgi:hypothetical protein
MPPQAANSWKSPVMSSKFSQSEQQSRYCRCKRINKREHMTYSARENNITCKAIWLMVKVQAV